MSLLRNESIHGVWNREQTFILAAVGAVIGFANIWRFPSLMAEHGGLVFVVAYLFALFTLVVPLAVLEVALGRWGRRSPVLSFEAIGGSRPRHSLWRWAGAMMMSAAAATVVIYSVVAGLSLAYVFKSAFGELNQSSAQSLVETLSALQGDTPAVIGWISLFISVVFVISVRGANNGLKRAVKYLVPVMIMLLLCLLYYAYRVGNFGSAMQYMFATDTGVLGRQTILAAFKHAFFSVGIGSGVLMMLGAYMPSHCGVVRPVLVVVAADSIFSVLAGLVILPWLLQAELPPTQGFELIFQSIPFALAKMPLGQFFGAVFFLLLTVAAWSSVIFLLEPLIAWVIEITSFRRISATCLVTIGVWGVSVLLAQSLNIESGSQAIPIFSGLLFVVSVFLIPMAAGLLAVLCGYVFSRGKIAEILNMNPDSRQFRFSYLLLRYISAPAMVIIQISLVLDFFLLSCQFVDIQGAPLCAYSDYAAESASAHVGTELSVETGKEVITLASAEETQANEVGEMISEEILIDEN